MQNPVPDEGGILKKSWFRIWDEEEPPQCDFIIQTMDTAFSTRTTADYSVIQTWGIFVTTETDSEGVERDIGNLILLGNVRGRFEYPELRSNAQDAFDEEGFANNQKEESWRAYFGRALSQMQWWSEAAVNHRQNKDPFELSKVFKSSPTQRNIS